MDYKTDIAKYTGSINDKAVDAMIGYMEHLSDFDPKTGKYMKADAAK